MAPVIKGRSITRTKSMRAPRAQATSTLDTSYTIFPASKKDKRTIKHSAFVGKIEKSSAGKSKRRRPNKKLVANLESLADALPSLNDGHGDATARPEMIQRKSLKSRPGAIKRKEKLERAEMDRFNKNLAQMAGTSRKTGDSAAFIPTADRWTALKSHIQSAVELNPEFIKK